MWQCLPVMEVYWSFDGQVNVLDENARAELEMELVALRAELRELTVELEETGDEGVQTQINGLENDIERIKDIID